MYQQQVIIIGAGIIGLSTAYALLKRGVRQVIVLEQASIDHPHASSHGTSRLLRFEYGPDALYSKMVQLSLQAWQRLEQATRRTLYTPTGLLVLGTEDDNSTLPSYSILREMGQPIEHLSKHQSMQRFPQFATHTYDTVTYNSEAGILHASACLHTLKNLIIGLGGEIYEACRVTHLTHNSRVRIHLSSGGEYIADRVVVATGPWVHRLLGNMHLPVQLTRQYQVHFTGLSSSSFGINNFPAFIAQDLYGFPLQPSCTHGRNGQACLKAASHTFGTPVDINDTSPPDEHLIAQVVRKVRALLPALNHAQLAHIDSCIYDVTPDEDFIIDRLPHDPRTILATGFSGHGFKFGLLLGELLSSMVCDTQPAVALERFQLARFAPQQVQERRSVA